MYFLIFIYSVFIVLFLWGVVVNFERCERQIGIVIYSNNIGKMMNLVAIN